MSGATTHRSWNRRSRIDIALALDVMRICSTAYTNTAAGNLLRLTRAFPGREIICIPTRALTEEGLR